MNAPVSIVLVGCGAVSRLFYQPALRELARHGIAKTIAVVDPSLEARGLLGAALGARPCSTLAEALVLGGQLAVVATPPNFHREQAEAAFAAGLDVLCEKPLASRAAEAEAMIAAGIRTGRLLAAGHYKRFFPAHRTLKLLIEQQTFGPLQSVEIAEGGKFAWPAASDSFFRKDQTSGGVLLDIGVHVLDLLLWWLGEPRHFSYADDANGGLEANCRFQGEFAGDVRVRLQLSRDWSTPNCAVFRFARATVHSRVNAANQLELTLDNIPVTFAAELREANPVGPGPATAPLETNPQAFIAQLVDVCGAVQTRRPPLIAGADGLRVIRLIERCYASRTQLSQPWLSSVP
jgi:predicted dehydrogenase